MVLHMTTYENLKIDTSQAAQAVLNEYKKKEEELAKTFGENQTLKRLSKLTGMQLDIVNFSGTQEIKVNIPPGVDREAYVDKFIEARNKAGISKKDMPVMDNIEMSHAAHDPDAFYLKYDTITPEVLTKLESNAGDFRASHATTYNLRNKLNPGHMRQVNSSKWRTRGQEPATA